MLFRHRLLSMVLMCLFILLIACSDDDKAPTDPGGGDDTESPPIADIEVPAFPGAEGFGAAAKGGRGGRVIKVTNLNDAGPGSLRDACNADGARIVVFDVGGTVTLNREIIITNPFITLAGQTAPGGGIAVRGGTFNVQTGDVIIRGMRFRPGDATSGSTDGIRINAREGQTSRNIIIDHCSVSWAKDENVSFFRSVENATLQWCIVAEGLVDNRGMNLVEQNGAVPKNISAHHNVYINHRARLPNVGPGAQMEFINNLIYNWEQRATDIAGLARVSIIANHYLDGPMNTGPEASPIRHGVWIRTQQRDMQVYVKDNIGFGRSSNTGSDWDIVDDNGTGEQYRVLAPPVELSGVVADNVEAVLDITLDYAGAIIPELDAVDSRLLNDVRNGTGGNITSQNDVGGWPDLNGTASAADSDGDGMPDSWESENGLNPNRASDAMGDDDQDGYANIEEYINSLIPPRD